MLSFFLIFLFFGIIEASSNSNTTVTGPLTLDFQLWLNKTGYAPYDFVRGDYSTQGSFGGKTPEAPEAIHPPVIFIHGNSDAALHMSSSATGWTNSIQYFLEHGYTVAELYATSWQDTNSLNSASRTHNCKDLIRLRKFLEAVLAYTGAGKVSVVSHSMGVTLARKIVKGGAVNATDGKCNLGLPLTRKVQVLVGISGANYGLCNCEGGSANLERTCNKENGLWPGDSCGLNYLDCGISPLPFACSGVTYSQFLMSLNLDKTREADYVFSMWSSTDDVIEYGDNVWGRPTSLIPTSDGKIVYKGYSHFQTKDLTAADQFYLVKNHKVPGNKK